MDGIDRVYGWVWVCCKYGASGLKGICERKLIDSMGVGDGATLFQEADFYSAKDLRDHCLKFIYDEFDAVSRTPAFEELCRANLKLGMEVLRRR